MEIKSSLQLLSAYQVMDELFHHLLFIRVQITIWGGIGLLESKKFRFSYAKKGWTDRVLGMEWLVEVFDKETRDLANGRWRYVIYCILNLIKNTNRLIFIGFLLWMAIILM